MQNAKSREQPEKVEQPKEIVTLKIGELIRRILLFSRELGDSAAFELEGRPPLMWRDGGITFYNRTQVDFLGELLQRSAIDKTLDKKEFREVNSAGRRVCTTEARNDLVIMFLEVLTDFGLDRWWFEANSEENPDGCDRLDAIADCLEGVFLKPIERQILRLVEHEGPIQEPKIRKKIASEEYISRKPVDNLQSLGFIENTPGEGYRAGMRQN